MALSKARLRIESPDIVSYELGVYESVSPKASLGGVLTAMHTVLRFVHMLVHIRTVGAVCREGTAGCDSTSVGCGCVAAVVFRSVFGHDSEHGSSSFVSWSP